jgi:hypothetical protein
MGLERFRLIFLIKSVKTTLPDSPMDQWLGESQRQVSAVKVDDRGRRSSIDGSLRSSRSGRRNDVFRVGEPIVGRGAGNMITTTTR